MQAGDRRDVEVPVRLTAAQFGNIVVTAKTTTSQGTQLQPQAFVVGTMPPAPPRAPIGVDEDLAELTVVRLAFAQAVVRFDNKELLIVRVGDRLGRNHAEIVEIAAGRLVLDETFVGGDGKPNRARITVKEGEKGGTRVLVRLEEQAPPLERQQ